MEVYLSQYSPLEREIPRKPGNFSSGAHETSIFFCLKENIERKPKEQPPGDRHRFNCTIFSAWSSVETIECKTSKNISIWFLTLYLTVLLREHSRTICEMPLFSALITSND